MEIESFIADGYVLNDSGEINESGKGGKLVSRIPVVPTAILQNMDSGVEKLEITFKKNGRWRKVVAPRSVTGSKTAIIRLADSGLEVNTETAGMLVRYLSDCVGQNLERIPCRDSKSVMGWVDGTNTFMPYTADIAFDGEDQFGYLYKAIRKRGSLDEWAKAMIPLRKNKALRLTMAASFASPLIEVIGENPFVFHLWGGTGTGKSVALLVAMSIWGDPNFGKLTRTMNMTANSMLSTAAFLKNLPFAGDELQTIKSRWSNYDNLIMQITEGIDRGRMTYDRLNETRSWKCSFIFSGEEPCIKAASGGGAKNRVIEVECAGKVVEEGNSVANFVKQHYGVAGPLFIENLDRKYARELYEWYFGEFLATGTTDKQAGAAALLLTADCLASELFWKEDEQDLVVDDLAPYLSSADEVDVTERAYAYTLDTVAENESCFHSDARQRWGCIDGDWCYINRTVLDRLLTEQGYDIGSVLNKWVQKGYVQRYRPNAIRWLKCIGGVVTSCIKLRLPADRDEQTEMEVGNDDL